MENFKNKYAAVSFYKEIETMIVVFNNFTPFEELKIILDFEFNMIRHYNVKKCLINLFKMQVYAPNSKEYIQNIWFPKASNEGIKYIAFVQPENTFGQIGMIKAHEGIKDGFMINYFDQQTKAQEWLNNIN